MPKTKKGKGDYYNHCSKDVYFRALLFLTTNRIRRSEEKSQWMKMGKRQGGGGRCGRMLLKMGKRQAGGGGGWKNGGNVERSRKVGTKDIQVKRQIQLNLQRNTREICGM